MNADDSMMIAYEGSGDLAEERPSEPRLVFFCPRSAPVLEYFNRWTLRQKIFIGFLVIAGIFSLAVMPLMPSPLLDPIRKEDVLNWAGIFWLGSEIACFLVSLRMWPFVRRFRRERRLAELALTELAPHEIAQIMIWRPLRATLLLIFLGGGFWLLVALIYVSRVDALLILAIITLNAVIIAYMYHWSALVISLGSQNAVSSICRHIAFGSVYGIWHLPAAVAAWGLVAMSSSEYSVFVLVIPLWMQRYLFARAFMRQATPLMAGGGGEVSLRAH